MKRLFILMALLCFEITSIAQIDVGMHFGGGVTSINSFKEANFSKGIVDVGTFINFNNYHIGMDMNISSMTDYPNTNGSQSKHEKWDALMTNVCITYGYTVFDDITIISGLDINTLKLYDVKKGYSNLTAYEKETRTTIGVPFGIIANINQALYLRSCFSASKTPYLTFSIGARLGQL